MRSEFPPGRRFEFGSFERRQIACLDPHDGCEFAKHAGVKIRPQRFEVTREEILPRSLGHVGLGGPCGHHSDLHMHLGVDERVGHESLLY